MTLGAASASSAASGAVLVDGEVVALQQAAVSVFDRGFLLGDAVFEVMRTYAAVPCDGMRHLQRLFRSCERILLSPPVSLEALREEVARAVAASGLAECYLRVVITRGPGPMHLDLDTAQTPRRIVYALPLRTLPPQCYTHGVGVRTVHGARGAEGGREVGAKSSNYLSNLLATHEVRGHGAHEALLVGPLGEILEGATSNVFLVTDRVVRTPPSRAGILEGITRAAVIRLARSLGLRVDETVLFPQDVYGADEAFITSSVREVVPVVSVDGLSLGAGQPGPITRQLMDAYRRWAEQAGWEG